MCVKYLILLLSFVVMASFGIVTLSEAASRKNKSVITNGQGKNISRPRRRALVIGNSNYHNTNKLLNPKNDAEAVARALNHVGFDVQLVLDGDLAKLKEAFALLMKTSGPDDVLLVFYAGHAFQHKGANLIAPVDMIIDAKTHEIRNTLNLSTMFRKLVKTSKTRLLLLDACRNDPTIGTEYGIKGRGVSKKTIVTRAITTRAVIGYENGLGGMKGREAGTFIAYSTAPGTVASDGLFEKSQHSPFTQALLKYILKPDMNVLSLMTKVTGEVYGKTKGLENRQLPWSESSLVEPFSFVNDKWKKRLVVRLQKGLKKRACFRGRIDGKWGKGVKVALARYNKLTGRKSMIDFPNVSTFEDIEKPHKGFYCPMQKNLPKGKRIQRKTKKRKSGRKVARISRVQPRKSRSRKKPKVISSRRPAAQSKSVKRRRASTPPSISGGVGLGSF